MGNGRKQPLVADMLATVCAVALLGSSALVEVDEPWWLRALGVVMVLAAPFFSCFPSFTCAALDVRRPALPTT